MSTIKTKIHDGYSDTWTEAITLHSTKEMLQKGRENGPENTHVTNTGCIKMSPTLFLGPF